MSEFAEHINTGNLAEALASVQRSVVAQPADAKLRTLLFQLLAVMGQWDRSLAQLDVVGKLDVTALAMVQAYREALRCELLRTDVFNGSRTPLVLGYPPPWFGPLIEALRLSASGEAGRAAALRTRAFEEAPATAGTIDDRPFEWIADGDTRLGPVLEAVVNGRYYWVPFHRIREVHIEAPHDLRDVVWTPAYFTWANNGEAAGFIPTRYPGSEASDDPLVRMSRKTTWLDCGEEYFEGLGQRVLATDAGEYPIMDTRHIVLESAISDNEHYPPETGEPTG